MRENHRSTSIRLTPTQRAKLDRMANELGISRNMVLEKLIANAKIQYADQKSDALTTISQVRAWLKSHALHPYIDPALLPEDGRLSNDATVRLVADATLSMLEECNSLSAPMSYRDIRRRAGVGVATVSRAMRLLTPWFLAQSGTTSDGTRRYILVFRPEASHAPSPAPLHESGHGPVASLLVDRSSQLGDLTYAEFAQHTGLTYSTVQRTMAKLLKQGVYTARRDGLEKRFSLSLPQK